MNQLLFNKFLLISVAIFFSLIREPGTLFSAELDGSLKGTIRLSGEMPPTSTIPIKINSEVCGTTYSNDFSINPKNKGVQNAFVSLINKSGPFSQSLRTNPVTLDNKNCHINPSSVAIESGQLLKIRNSDPVLHVLRFVQGDSKLFDAALAPGGNVVQKKFIRTGLIRIQCTIHSFMTGTILVSDTPDYTVSDQNGYFELGNIKPGGYFLTIWQQWTKPVKKEIEILSGQNLNLTFDTENN